MPGKNQDRERERFLRALELQWDYYGPFGFAAVLADENEPLYDISKRVSGETLLKKGIALAGHPSDVAGEIIKIKEDCGYEDYMVNAWFETRGSEGREIEDQMQYFAEEVTPLLRRACGGQVQNPPLAVNLAPANGKI
ncbi:MAG: hypothetical protein JO166_00565 [Deltaproteobacteria bacterium]|nr:hypothetical protein [Deltaproteobacteria bacterium]